MELTGKTKFMDMLKEYPFLLDYLLEMSDKYDKLNNSLTRRTMGRFATLDTVAGMGDFETPDFLSRIEKEIERNASSGTSTSTATVQPDIMDSSDAQPPSREERNEILKGIINDIHKDVDMDILKARFADLIKDVSPIEIAAMEQALIDEGMPEMEVKKLCDVHVEVFKQSLDAQPVPESQPGHPIHTFMMENRESERMIKNIEEIIGHMGNPPDPDKFNEGKPRLVEQMDALSKIDYHYLRKENQLFPLLESRDVSGPTQVMWAIHDDIRLALKKAKTQISENDLSNVINSINEVTRMINDMVYKEEQILYPMALEVLNSTEWLRVKHGGHEIGYSWIQPGEGWGPAVPAKVSEPVSTGPAPDGDITTIPLSTGRMTPEQIDLVLTHLPVDITYVDENGTVAYYSAGKHRIFPRSAAIIGRQVSKCHPPKSVHIVEKIVEEFRAGRKDVSEFWLNMEGRVIYIRYFAVRDPDGTYKGVVEVSQDITDIQMISGEKRLLDWK
ncbi:MAG: DUF438 domain-containing protein [Thermoplasmata archaeon]|nr:DUF438 domain-containing protein [Thermoplasmata archaeon]